ncbi:MAG: carbohydrate-binding protein [Verrucomicrobiota bacterium]
MKLLPALTAGVAALLCLQPHAYAQSIPPYVISDDLLIAQFDLKPDMDDVHSAAALACMFAHESLAGVDYFVYSGTYGNQGGAFITEAEALDLYDVLFGSDKWLEVKDENGPVSNYNDLVRDASTRAVATVNSGGNVWVQEAGQSDFTLDWVREMRTFHGLTRNEIRESVFVVQHSFWNENFTSGNKLNTLKNWVTYITIDDGNRRPGFYDGINIVDRGVITPCFNTRYSSPTDDTQADQVKYLGLAKGEPGYPANPNARAVEIWTKADEVADTWDETPDYSPIDDGGVDFSDCIESWYIFEDADVTNIDDFWAKYVTNTPTSSQQQPYPNPQSPASLPGTVQAMNYDSGGQGVAYNDSDTGNNGEPLRTDDVDIASSGAVGWTTDGEWLEYTVNTTAGTYDLSASVSSNISTGNKQLRVLLDGSQLALLNIPFTAGWTNFQTVTASGVSIPSVQNGVLRLEIVGGSFNIDTISVGAGGSALRIEAESFDSMSGIQTQTTNDTGGGLHVGFTNDGDWLEYQGVDFPSAGQYPVDFRVAADTGLGGDIRILSNGAQVGYVTIPATGGWQTWTTVSTTINIPTSGIQTVRLEMVDSDPAAFLFNLNWFEIFSGSSGGTLIISDNFNSGFGNWTDGGADARLQSTGNLVDGTQCVALQDDTTTSNITTGDLALSQYSQVIVQFDYRVESFENTEEFLLEISTDGGSSYTIAKAWVNNVDFVDDGTIYLGESFTISQSTLTNQTRIRFRCNASGNSDDVFIDNISISAQ